jgi:Protein of unknown function (DUF2975)
VKRKSLLFNGIVAILKVTSIVSVVYIILILLYALADIRPYITFSNGDKLGFVDAETGIPTPIRMSVSLEDSSFFDKTAAGSRIYGTGYKSAMRHGVFKDATPRSPAIYSDTIVTQYAIANVEAMENKNGPAAYIAAGSITSGVIHVVTGRRGWRVLLLSPLILFFSLIAFCAWQIARLLNDILAGNEFGNGNYTRLRNIGWGVIAYQLFLFLLQLAVENQVVFITFYSTIPNYRSPVDLVARPQIDCSFTWMIGGIILLILAYAFKKGHQLQLEQDLTI